MTYYPLPNATDYHLPEFVQYLNKAADGIMMPVLILVLWLVMFIGTKKFRSSVAFTFSSLFCGILSIMLALLDMMAKRYMYLLGIMVAFGAVWMVIENARE